MDPLKAQLASLLTVAIGKQSYLPYQAVTDAVAAFLFPNLPPDQIDETRYQRILEAADSLCRDLGYSEVVKLTPPDVAMSQMGLYWSAAPPPAPDSETAVIHAGPGPVEMLQDGKLLDARLSQLGLDEVTRQHFKIPVTASDGLIDLMQQAVASKWPNDYRGIWHDLCGMCVVGGKDVSPIERRFTVIIRGVGQQRYWPMKALLKHDATGGVYLKLALAEEADAEQLFELGQVVMTPGVADLEIDIGPYLARHHRGDWGDLDSFDQRQNDNAIKGGLRLLSAYDVPLGDDAVERIWIITEADRSSTCCLLPGEY